MKRLLVYFKGYRKESVIAPLFKMLEAIFELLVPLAVAHIIDVGIAEKDGKTIWAMCGVMVLLGIIGLLCAVCAQYFSAKAAVGVSAKIRSVLFEHIQSFSYAMTDRLGTSTLITRMTGDINAVQTGINMFLRLFMRSPFIVFGAMIMAFTIDRPLAWIFVWTIVLLSVIVFGIMLISIPIMKRSQAQLDTTLSHVRSHYNGTRVVRAFCREDRSCAEFGEKHAVLTKIQLLAGRVSGLLNPLTYVIINFSVILLIRNGAMTVQSGDLTQGELIALYNYMSQILVELIKLASLIITLNKATASASRIATVLDMPSDVEHYERQSPESTKDPDAIICFENVSFRYHPDSDMVLNHISFSAYAGETIGIIGGTGSGKSTLANLIAGFYRPSEGQIFLDGKPIEQQASPQDRFGIVPQKAVLFKGTIRSNMRFGNEEADDAEIWSALSFACAASFVRKKADGLDEAVAQSGSNFSGGQRQRLTIARALIKKPELLILDDSASALDYATEAELRRNINRLDYHPTVFLISQRASTLLHADRILVLEDGELVGVGTHRELLDSCDVYCEIFRSQFSEQEEINV